MLRAEQAVFGALAKLRRNLYPTHPAPIGGVVSQIPLDELLPYLQSLALPQETLNEGLNAIFIANAQPPAPPVPNPHHPASNRSIPTVAPTPTSVRKPKRVTKTEKDRVLMAIVEKYQAADPDNPEALADLSADKLVTEMRLAGIRVGKETVLVSDAYSVHVKAAQAFRAERLARETSSFDADQATAEDIRNYRTGRRTGPARKTPV